MVTTVRQATTADAPALAELAAATFPLACPPGSRAEDIAAFVAANLSEASFARHLSDPARAVFVADGGAPGPGRPRLLGYTMVVDVPPLDADLAAAVGGGAAVELSKCYARPECHGSGTSSRLMAAGLQWARSRGAQRMWLGVNSENARAKKFYEKHGFTVAGSKSFQLGKRVEHDLVMVRPVQG